MDILGFVITVFAAARLTRLVTEDTITAPLRDPVLARVLRSKAERTALAELPADQDFPPPKKFRTFVYTLLTCHWCVGFWITAAVIAAHALYSENIIYKLIAATLAASYLVGWFADNEGGE